MLNVYWKQTKNAGKQTVPMSCYNNFSVVLIQHILKQMNEYKYVLASQSMLTGNPRAHS